MLVAVSGLMDGMNFYFIISRSHSAALNNNNKLTNLSRFHFYFFSKTRKSFVGGTVNLKIKNLWP